MQSSLLWKLVMARLFRVKKAIKAEKRTRLRRWFLVIVVILTVATVAVGGYVVYQRWIRKDNVASPAAQVKDAQEATPQDEVIAGYDALLETTQGNKEEHLSTLYSRARVYELDGEYDKAITAYQEILRQYPEEPSIYAALGRVYQGKNNLVAAQDAYSQALRYANDDMQRQEYQSILDAVRGE